MCLGLQMINTPIVKHGLILRNPLNQDGERSILELTLIKIKLRFN